MYHLEFLSLCNCEALPARPVSFAAAVPGIKKEAKEPKPCPNCVLNLSSYPSAGFKPSSSPIKS